MRLVRTTFRAAERTAQCMIGDFGVSLYSDLPQVLRDFASLYLPRAHEPVSGDRTIHIEVRCAGRSALGRSLYRVTADGTEVGGRSPAYGVFPLVEWGINLRIMATRSEFVQLHAASMVFGSHGFIFAGDSGCGKSTLAATLLARGWQYLCDEFALVDKNSLVLHAFPKALCIKAGSYPVIRKLGLPLARRRDYVKAFKGRVGYINPRELGPERVGSGAPVRFIVFPKFKADSAPSLTPMSRADAVTELYRYCFNKDAIPAGALATLTQLVSQAECTRFVVGDTKRTVDLLESLPAHFSRSDSRTATERVDHASQSVRLIDRVASRRDVLKVGAKLAYVAPCVLTLTSQQAFAAPSNPSGICSTATHTGQICLTDLDCCSKECSFGLCQ